MTSALAVATGGPVFTQAHIALTAAVTGLLALAAAAWRLPKGAWTDIVAVAVLSAASVYLWRASANMPQLNDDGLPGFSANDWAAPVLTFVFLGVYARLRPAGDPRRYGQAGALAVIASLAVNVITI